MFDAAASYESLLRLLQQLESRVQDVDLAAELIADLKVRLVALQSSIDALLKLTGS